MLHTKTSFLSALSILVLTSAVQAQTLPPIGGPSSNTNTAVAKINGDLRQENNGDSSYMVTGIGSTYSKTGAGKTASEASVDGHVDIRNEANNTAMATLIGAIHTDASNPSIKAAAAIHGDVDILNEDNGLRTTMYTQLGSVNSSRLEPFTKGGGISRQEARLDVKGDVVIQNRGADSYLNTQAGSIEAAGSSDRLKAEADINDGGLRIFNYGDHAELNTAVGSIAGFDPSSATQKSFSSVHASAVVDHGVEHVNDASGAKSSFMIGSVR